MQGVKTSDLLRPRPLCSFRQLPHSAIARIEWVLIQVPNPWAWCLCVGKACFRNFQNTAMEDQHLSYAFVLLHAYEERVGRAVDAGHKRYYTP